MNDKRKNKLGSMLTDEEVAEQLRWSIVTLRCRRSEGKPVPKFIKYSSRMVRTPQKYLDQFIAEHIVCP